MNLNPSKLWSALVATTAVCAAMPVLVAMKPQGRAEYDYALSRQKLETIGRALQLYRQEYGIKPVEDRRDFSDAGLPFYLIQLAHPNRSHPIPKDTFLMPYDVGKNYASSFVQLYRVPGQPEFDVRSPLFAERGEKLAIFVDLNMNGEAEVTGKAPSKALVLRLDGTVDLVEVNKFGTHALLDK
jgi:hypothetical protein